MRNAFIFSVILLIIVSFLSCSKEINVSRPNAIVANWNIDTVIFYPNFDDEKIKPEVFITNGSKLEFIEGTQPNSGSWIESIRKDTFRIASTSTNPVSIPNQVLSGQFKLIPKQVIRYLSNSSDTLDIVKNINDTLVLSTIKYDSVKVVKDGKDLFVPLRKKVVLKCTK
jgi:hypothetical protein